MDIVHLEKTGHNYIKKHKKHRNPERRHTTEVRFSLEEDQPLTNGASHSATDVNRISSNAVCDSSRIPREDSSQELSGGLLQSNWSLFEDLDFETTPTDYQYFHGSQVSSFSEAPSSKSRAKYDVAKHQYQLSYEIAMDNVLTPFSDNVLSTRTKSSRPKLSHIDHVIQELQSTERVYVRDLTEVVEGYRVPLLAHIGSIPVHEWEVELLFGNVCELLEFHKLLLESLETCSKSPVKISQCFLSHGEDFKVYTQYCNNYPRSVDTLSRLCQNQEVAIFLKRCQERLKHMLPLGAYLLKPVQRVLKYSLLLANLLKHIEVHEPSYFIIQSGLRKMTEVAEHINAMKRKYDAAVHAKEIQSLIRGIEDLDLTQYGDIIEEDNLRYTGTRSSGPTLRGKSDRYLFLFERLCLITKKDEDGYQYKAHLEMKDLQLTEKVDRDVASFHIRQVSTGRAYTFQARSVEQKNRWVHAIKLQLMESLPDLPDKAKEMIMKGFTVSETGNSQSPKSRHRHYSEEPILPSMSSPKSEHSPFKSRTLGSTFRASPLVVSGKKQRRVSVTTTGSPALSQDTPVKANLAGFLQSSVSLQYQVEQGSPKVDNVSEGGHLQVNNEGQVNSQSESSLQKCAKLGLNESGRLAPQLLENSAQGSGRNSPKRIISSPQLSRKLDNEDKETFTITDLNNSTIELEIVSTTFNSPGPPEVEVEIEDDEPPVDADSIASDHEALFDELMGSMSSSVFVSSPEHPLSPTLAVADILEDTFSEVPTSQETVSSPSPVAPDEHDSDMETNTTPKASPYVSPASIRRWSITKQRNIELPENEELSTPVGSPKIPRSESAMDFKTPTSPEVRPSSETQPRIGSVGRRHSFGSTIKRAVLHRREGSISTGNSPVCSPKPKPKKRKSWLKNTLSISRPRSPSAARKLTASEISVVGLIDTSPSDSHVSPNENREHKRKSIILPPPLEFSSGPDVLPNDSSRPSSGMSGTATCPSPVLKAMASPTVLHTNPEEVISVDEMLQNFNDFSDVTGITNKTPYRSRSPEPKKKKKKKKKPRSMTVATVDANTMKQVREEMAYQDSLTADDGKVHRLAREYSQRIRENEKILPRFARVVEQASDQQADGEQPVWLRSLRDKRRSRENLSSSLDFSKVAQITPRAECDSEPSPEETNENVTKKKRFKGWVLSIVDKFSTGK